MKPIFSPDKRIYAIALLFIGFTFLMACKKEKEVIIPTETPEKTWVLPQGDHPFDQRIQSYYDRFGTFLLYKFTEQDVYWNIGTNIQNYRTVPADETYIPEQLDLLDNTFFSNYQDSTLRKYLPIKMFLCSSVRLGTTNPEVNAFLIGSNEAATITGTTMGGYQSFAVNWGRKAVLRIKTPIDSVTIFKNDVNFSFLKMGNITGKMGKSVDFLTSSDYTTILPATPAVPTAGTPVVERYKRGFIGVGTTIPTPNSDWYAYLRAITSTPYEDLTNNTTPITDATYKGMLNGLKDPNGLIKKKYNLMINFYKRQYNIDLQAIGNWRAK
ncbi:hypothetical protein OQX61_13060 [Pedobacter sp. PLR]|uniref:hypothetical protein n=1 Tax=Pedobacter sp. PLR TaxID=2994465 RepID=UPI002248316D|nr:hypothetical protein [Pedobacter sp. PLR]MCX2452196.1 hypothetical protein [Pedobacter sp. PLR]